MKHNSDFNPHTNLTLTPDDQRLVDALVDSGFDRNILSAVSRDDSRRLDAITGLLGLLKDYPVEDANETLVHATLARIDRHEAEQAARLNLGSRQAPMEGEKRGWRIRVPDFISVAAVLLIGASVLWPVLSSVRQNSIRTACQSNMRQLAYAFGQYAADNNGMMPLAMAGPAMSWDRVPNVLNLEPLIRHQYCEQQHLNCPGHDHSHHHGMSASYSYRQMPAGVRLGWGTGRITIVLADLNPVVDAAYDGRFVEPLSVSLNHAGRGQNVLVSDGSTDFLERPVFVRNDNIWLPHMVDRLTGGERPADETDVFLTH